MEILTGKTATEEVALKGGGVRSCRVMHLSFIYSLCKNVVTKHINSQKTLLKEGKESDKNKEGRGIQHGGIHQAGGYVVSKGQGPRNGKVE